MKLYRGEAYIRFQFLHPEGGWGLEQVPREVVKAPSLSEFKKYLDNALSSWQAGLESLLENISLLYGSTQEEQLCDQEHSATRRKQKWDG